MKENILTQPLIPQTEEIIPVFFPIINDKKIYFQEDKPDLREGEINHFIKQFFPPATQNNFNLLKTIGGLHYIFTLQESYDGAYFLSFKTEEYEYATTNLKRDQQNILWETISIFLESIATHTPVVREILIFSADASYSSEEIEDCTKKILSSPQNTLTKEQLVSEYKGFEIFDLYRDIFKKDFQESNYNIKSRAKGRSRFFKIMAKKHLKNWEIETQGFHKTRDFSLKRKTIEK